MENENVTVIKPKNLEQRLQENPNHLKELIHFSEVALTDNAKYFCSQPDIPALMEFLLSHDIQIALRGKGLDKTLKALQRLQMCHHQYKEEIELFTTQQKWFDNLNNHSSTSKN